MDAGEAVTLLLGGDVMTGRGVDQALPHPGDPRLHEPWVKDAREYVALAERAHGPIPRPVAPGYPWGDALAELERVRPAARIVNLETAVTSRGEPWPGKGIHYRMHPANAACLTAAGLDCCVLANNHVLDWGREGLLETLDALAAPGIAVAGAGRDREQAEAPAALPIPHGGRVLVFAFADRSSGVPREWAASAEEPGVDLLPDLSPAAAERIAERVAAVKRPGDLVVASIHWGPNWGWDVGRDERAFAHRLLDDAGVDLVHGHSSHHPKGIEVHRGKLVLYGCGDLLDDYEGITGYEQYRDDLMLLYFPALEPASGRLAALEMTPLRMRRFRLEHPPAADVEWLRATLDRESRRLGAEVELTAEGRLRLGWG
jgi:poly-gamma-glutamate synthesis protein (capsule biosynthesis protein)